MAKRPIGALELSSKEFTGSIAVEHDLNPASVIFSDDSHKNGEASRLISFGVTHGMEPPQYSALSRFGVEPETTLQTSPSLTILTRSSP